MDFLVAVFLPLLAVTFLATAPFLALGFAVLALVVLVVLVALGFLPLVAVVVLLAAAWPFLAPLAGAACEA